MHVKKRIVFIALLLCGCTASAQPSWFKKDKKFAVKIGTGIGATKQQGVLATYTSPFRKPPYRHHFDISEYWQGSYTSLFAEINYTLSIVTICVGFDYEYLNFKLDSASYIDPSWGVRMQYDDPAARFPHYKTIYGALALNIVKWRSFTLAPKVYYGNYPFEELIELTTTKYHTLKISVLAGYEFSKYFRVDVEPFYDIKKHEVFYPDGNFYMYDFDIQSYGVRLGVNWYLF